MRPNWARRSCRITSSSRGIGLLEGTLEVIALGLQSIERGSLPLNKTFRLDQPRQQLIWIERVFGMTS